MDTGTHFVIGLSLVGLSTIDQTVFSNPELTKAVLFGVVIGSQAPDFDSLSRFFGGAKSYVRYHRGITHSIPALFIMPTIISFLLNLFFQTSFAHLWLWTFVAVFLHVFLDIFNSYGTQALLPLSNKWISLDVINIFDPFIFVSHLLAIILWSISFPYPTMLFIVVFSFTILYILLRTLIHWQKVSTLVNKHALQGNLKIVPTIGWSVWNVIAILPDEVNIGVLRGDILNWVDNKKKAADNQAIVATKKDPKIQALLYFSDYAFPESKKTSYGYEVRWIDLRYRLNNQYPFLAIALLDESYNIIDSYIGWIYNKNQINKKLHSMLKINKA